MVVVAKMGSVAGKWRSWRKDDKVDGCGRTWMTEDLVGELDGVVMVRWCSMVPALRRALDLW